MFINFWYPACSSSDVTAEKPLKVRMLGLNFVLFRDTTGAVRCLANTCTHRGGSLGSGKLRDDCVECPYHGWRFNGAGECVRIPTIGVGNTIPARTRIDSYPVQERYGLVFCFLGDLPEAERPPIADLPPWRNDEPDPGWRSLLQVLEWNVDYKRSIENSLDPVHNDWVHSTHGSSTEDARFEVWNQTAWGAGVKRTALSPPMQDEALRKASGRFDLAVASTLTAHHGPNHILTHINPSPVLSIWMCLFETPIDETHTRIFLMSLRNQMTSPADDGRFGEIMLRNANQDQVVLEQLEPVVTARVGNSEVFMHYDVAVTNYRKSLQAWQARGWRIDSDEFRRRRELQALAIPSPARREVKGWAIDTVPLLPGS